MESRQTPQERELSFAEKLSDRFTRSVGTPTSIIVHTIFFIGSFSLQKFGFTIDQILLVLTTAVSLEAIYLAIFIQMTVNRQTARLYEVSENIEEISEDVEDIGKDIDEIQEDIDEISEDVDEIQEDIDEISEDVDDLSEDMEEESKEDTADREQYGRRLQKIEDALLTLVKELEEIKTKK